MPKSRQSRQPETLASIGRQLSHVLKNEAAKPHEVDELLWAATRVEEADSSLIASFMVDHLVPRCVAAASGEGHEQVRSSQLRRLMADWINGLPENILWDVRRVVMESVIESLRSAPTFEGMYSLASIGYRSPDTIGILSTLGERDDRLGHEAMRLRLALSLRQRSSPGLRDGFVPPRSSSVPRNCSTPPRSFTTRPFCHSSQVMRSVVVPGGSRSLAYCGSGRSHRVTNTSRTQCGRPFRVSLVVGRMVVTIWP